MLMMRLDRAMLLGNRDLFDPNVDLKALVVAYWKLDEAGALTDEGGSGTHWGTVGGPTEVAGLVYGTSVEFVRASTQYLTIPAAQGAALGLPTDDQAFTVSGWFKLTAKSDYYGLFTRADGAAGKDGTYAMYRWHSPDRYSFYLGNNTSFAQVFADSYGATVVGAKVFVVCWHDPVADTINIQVNDGTVDSVSWSGGTQGLGSLEGSAVTNVGATINSFDRADVIAGPVYKFDSVLSAQNRSDLYNAGSGVTVLPPGIAALNPVWFKLDAVDSDRLDSGPNGYHLTDFNTVPSGTGKVYARAAAPVAANSEYLQRTVSASGGQSDFSVEAWVLSDSIGSYRAAYSSFIGGAHFGFGTLYWSSADKFEFAVRSTFLTNPTALSAGTWYHLIATYTAATDTAHLYVNDDSGATTTITGGNSTSTNLTIGRPGVVDGQYWNGRVGPVAVYSAVLTAAQRTRLFNGGSGLALY